MENFPKDILIKIALDYDLPDIMAFCLTSSIINRKLCLNQMFWMKKLSNDYNIFNKDIPEKYKLQDGRFDYKKYYLYIDYMLKKYSNPDGLLIKGSKKGDLNLVKISLKRGSDIHAKDDVALRSASMYGYLEMVKYLVKSGANINNLWPLRHASQKGNLEIVKYLVKVGGNKEEALIWASYGGSLKTVKFLIESGTNIHAEADDALMEAIENGHINVVRFLIESGANIHAQDDFALILAREYGHTDILKLLLSS